MTKDEQLKRMGEYEIRYYDMADWFDPMRLKILLLPRKDANPFGRNPDYYFLKGHDFLRMRDYNTAIQHFQKGVSDKGTHYLCRFNLGFTLFKVGHFQAAVEQYTILVHQCVE